MAEPILAEAVEDLVKTVDSLTITVTAAAAVKVL
jgi:hypothetical protein